ncbi:hypothetical protein M0804_000464 [Polistes exclamans]|nr:hypothetical protein M0804_000464 [Polistes exclamans]
MVEAYQDLEREIYLGRRNLFAERQVAYAAHCAHLRSSFWNSFSRFASPMEAAAGDMQQQHQLGFDLHISAFVPSLYARPMTV